MLPWQRSDNIFKQLCTEIRPIVSGTRVNASRSSDSNARVGKCRFTHVICTITPRPVSVFQRNGAERARPSYTRYLHRECISFFGRIRGRFEPELLNISRTSLHGAHREPSSILLLIFEPGRKLRHTLPHNLNRLSVFKLPVLCHLEHKATTTKNFSSREFITRI